jgi:hypothetical protein
LTEHAAALEEIRDQLREDIEQLVAGGLYPPNGVAALDRIDHEIAYIRQLAGIDQEEQDAHEY